MTGETETSRPWRVGIHTSIAGSFDQAGEKAYQLGCSTFQIFSSSPRMWKTREPRSEEITALARLRQRYDLRPLVIHANYLLNLASPDPLLRSRSIEALGGEIGRATALGAEYLVLHPGSYRNSSAEMGIRTLASSIQEAARNRPLGPLTVLIENTCGQGNTLGGRFEELRDILAMIDGLPAGCCIDTAHCYAAGMDISSRAGLKKIIESLQQTVGLHRVKVIHVNDSRSALGSHLDRHEHIGKGGIGMEGFRRIVNDPSLRDKAFILETPLDRPQDDRRNLEVIRSLRSGARRPQTGKSRAAAETETTRVRREGTLPSEIQMPPSRVRRRGKANR